MSSGPSSASSHGVKIFSPGKRSYCFSLLGSACCRNEPRLVWYLVFKKLLRKLLFCFRLKMSLACWFRSSFFLGEASIFPGSMHFIILRAGWPLSVDPRISDSRIRHLFWFISSIVAKDFNARLIVFELAPAQELFYPYFLSLLLFLWNLSCNCMRLLECYRVKGRWGESRLMQEMLGRLIFCLRVKRSMNVGLLDRIAFLMFVNWWWLKLETLRCWGECRCLECSWEDWLWRNWE